MIGSIPWTLLEEEYQSYGEELLEELKKLIHSPEAIVCFKLYYSIIYELIN